MKSKFRVGDVVTYTHELFGTRRGRVVSVGPHPNGGELVEVSGAGFGAWVESRRVRLDLIATLAQIA